MQILKICEYCKKDLIAKKTTSKTCSDDCAKRLYKLNQRNKKIHHEELKTEIKRKAKAFIKEDQIKAMQAKENLTLKEAAFYLNISPLTLHRWILGGNVRSNKIGKKQYLGGPEDGLPVPLNAAYHQLIANEFYLYWERKVPRGVKTYPDATQLREFMDAVYSKHPLLTVVDS